MIVAELRIIRQINEVLTKFLGFIDCFQNFYFSLN